jgi:hypothetical protein
MTRSKFSTVSPSFDRLPQWSAMRMEPEFSRRIHAQDYGAPQSQSLLVLSDNTEKESVNVPSPDYTCFHICRLLCRRAL